MATVQVVDMVTMRDGGVSAARRMLVGVIGMNEMFVHADQCPRASRRYKAGESKTRSHSRRRSRLPP
jgi:hypothetical protein